jgi:serine/threonine protein kinase
MPLKHENMLNRKMKTFTFINILGEGAFAKVYEGVDERDSSQIAVKVIPKQLMKETPKLDELVKT